MGFVSRIIHVKGRRRLKISNKLNFQRRLSIPLATVWFRGTPCIYILNKRLLVCKIEHYRFLNVVHSNVVIFAWVFLKITRTVSLNLYLTDRTISCQSSDSNVLNKGNMILKPYFYNFNPTLMIKLNLYKS